MNPRVSIVLAARNEERFIDAAIESIVHQTEKSWELLLIDDGSTDETTALCEAWSRRDGRIRFLRHESPNGLSRCLNEGLGMARAEIIARMDGDDIAHPERLSRQLRVLESDATLMILGTAVWYLSESGERLFRSYHVEEHTQIARLLPRTNVMNHPTLLMRRGPWLHYNEEFEYAQDYELYLRALRAGVRFANLNQPLLDYRLKAGGSRREKRERQRELENHARRLHGFPEIPVSTEEDLIEEALHAGNFPQAARCALRRVLRGPSLQRLPLALALLLGKFGYRAYLSVAWRMADWRSSFRGGGS